MPYAIMRFEKRKSGAVGGLDRHHERKKKEYASNPDIDKRRTENNYHIIEARRRYRDEIQARVNAAGCKVRKDSVVMIDTLITASPEFFQKHSSKEQREYFERAVDFIRKEVGEDNIMSAVVHMDERTPHMHLCFTPITPDKRLCAKEVIGNRDHLIKWQDKFHEYMSEAFPDLDRGEPAMETKRKHMPVRIYKQAVRLTEEMAFIKNKITGIGTFNAQKKKEQVLELLNRWMPQYNSLQAQLEPFQRQIKETQEDNQYMHEKVERQSWEVQRNKNDANNLRQQLWEYEEFIESIPEDLREELQQRFERIQEQEQARDQTFSQW